MKLSGREMFLIAELKGRICRCGADKRTRNTFCQKCYFALPGPLRKRLYDLVGEGYEQAYDEAVAFLLSKERGFS